MSSVHEQEATYNPNIFNVFSEQQAKDIILTRGGFDQDAGERWVRETPYLIDLILSKVDLGEKSLVLDYGCGIGRLSKELIDKSNCEAIGVDISPSMRGFAAPYVNSDSFFACSPKSFEMIRRYIKFDLVVAVWVLQHCLEPENDLLAIRESLLPGAKMFVVNNVLRAVPTIERGWANDGIDIQGLIEELGFRELETGSLDPTVVPGILSEATFWGLYEWR